VKAVGDPCEQGGLGGVLEDVFGLDPDPADAGAGLPGGGCGELRRKQDAEEDDASNGNPRAPRLRTRIREEGAT
jgi:hypothetical protein